MDCKICVVGLGYIGLPTASFLGTKGYEVCGVDVSAEVVETINRGDIHILEPDLDVLVKSAVGAGRLRAVTEPEEADVFIIAVPTPLAADNTPDLSFVEAAGRAVAKVLRSGNLVILESTCPVGTTDGLLVPLLEMSGLAIGEEVFVAHCPERVLPGRILSELVENDRIVGGVNDASADAAAAFYATFIRGNVCKTNARTAEMAKLAENTYRDVNIALANELSMISDKQGINPWDMIELANRHPRVDILQPGPGVGGHCIAVDPWFVVARAPDCARLIRTARAVNDRKPDWVFEKVVRHAARFRDPVIACLGLAFKADIDDLRGSPALYIVRRLQSEKAGRLLVCEPNLAHHDEFDLVPLNDAVSKADIVLLLVDHTPFRKLRGADLQDKVVIDTRGMIR